MFISEKELSDIHERLKKLEKAAIMRVPTGETACGIFGIPYTKTIDVSAVRLIKQLADALGYSVIHTKAETGFQKKAKADK